MTHMTSKTTARTRTTALAVPLVLMTGLLAGCGTATVSPKPSASSASSTASSAPDSTLRATLARIERRHHARLGLYAVDTGTGRTVAYRADERFAHCSTFKALEDGVLLRRASDAQLDRVAHYRRSDLETYSPVTGTHLGTGMTERQLIAAAMDHSDNTAANLLLERLGGPHGLQAALRALGDRTIHADRPEPEVNEVTPGDVRDTSTPRSIGTDLRLFAVGDGLRAQRRAEYNDILNKNTTGGAFIRAGVPHGWSVGDKTGNGGYGTRNDIAVLRPPTGAPLVLAILTDRGKKDAPSDDALIADATRAVAAVSR